MNRKELREQYKNRTVIGGVYRILNTKNQRFYLDCDSDLAGSRNRHSFAVSTDLCVIPGLQEDWKRDGPAAFVFEALEELEKKPEQTDKEFAEELHLLLELWREKLSPFSPY